MSLKHRSHLFLIPVLCSGCLMLKTYEPRNLPADTSGALKRYEQGGPLGDALRASRALADHYQQKLVPVLSEMHQSAKATGQAKQSRLLGQARGHTAEMSLLAAKAQASWQQYRQSLGGSGGSRAMVAEIGFRLNSRCLVMADKTRRMLDLTEGYIRAGVEKNLSYLSLGNQRQFNREMSALDAAGAAILSDYESLIAALHNLQGN